MPTNNNINEAVDLLSEVIHILAVIARGRHVQLDRDTYNATRTAQAAVARARLLIRPESPD